MEYIVGPFIALLIGLKFTDIRVKNAVKEHVRIDNLEERVIRVEDRADKIETVMPQKIVATMMPVAKAVQKLNQQVGIQ